MIVMMMMMMVVVVVVTLLFRYNRLQVKELYLLRKQLDEGHLTRRQFQELKAALLDNSIY